MKGISPNSAVSAYQRAAVKPVGPARGTSDVNSPVARPDPDAAKVSISNQARELAAESAVRVDSQKVEALRAQVETGVYQVDPHRIASRMLGVA